jgi:hypothetical protein
VNSKAIRSSENMAKFSLLLEYLKDLRRNTNDRYPIIKANQFA